PSLSLRTPRPHTPTLFPYTTLFRSGRAKRRSRIITIVFHARVHRTRPIHVLDATGKFRFQAFHVIRFWAIDEVAVDERRRVRIRSEEHTSELQSRFDLVCRLLLEKK